MLASKELPSECKQTIWWFLEATDLCRVVCVAKHVEDGVNVGAMWRIRVQQLIQREQTRIADHRTPIECGLQRQCASRNLNLSDGKAKTALRLKQRRVGHNDGGSRNNAINVCSDHPLYQDSTFWRHWYRDFFVSIQTFDRANVAFQNAKTKLSETKCERSELKDMLQTVKSKHQNDKHMRRMQMNCVRWMNRSHRRLAANEHSINAQHVALCKNEITEQLGMLESAVQVQSKELFVLRSQYQKSLHRMTSQLARGTRMLRDLTD